MAFCILVFLEQIQSYWIFFYKFIIKIDSYAQKVKTKYL